MATLSVGMLKSLNLSEAQGAVYVAALELGQATMQALAKKSGVKRTSIYNFIEEMKERQLIVETRKKKRNVYSAVAPDQLMEMERLRLHELQQLMPELTAIQNKGRNKPHVTFYEGVEGIKEVYADSLKEKKTIYGFWDYENATKVMGEEYYDSYYRPERKRLNIFYKGILRDSPATRASLQYDNKAFRESKFIQKGEFTTEINIYGNKVALLSFLNKPPFGVLIEDKDIADTLRTAWENLWDKLGDVAKYQENLPTERTENID